ncbi:unnamed protein product, partial [Onchocerca flexuosa]
MLTNFTCFVPSILLLLNRRSNRWAILLMVADILCIIVQIIVLWMLPNLNASFRNFTFTLPLCLILISLGWWQNFAHVESVLAPIRALARFAVQLNERRSKTYVFISVWKCIVYLLTVLFVLTNNITSKDLFKKDPFGEKLLVITARNMSQTQINKFYNRLEMEMANNGMQIKNAPPVLKNHGGRDNHDSRFFPDKSQSINRKPSPKLLPETQLFQKINEQDNRNTITSSPVIKPKELLENTVREESEKSSRNRKKRRIDDDEYEIPPNTYNIYDDYVELNQYTVPFDALWIVLIQAIAVILTYHTSKFAC